MKVGIIGGGVVGRATARAFIENVDEVRVWDIVQERCTAERSATLACDLVFLCLPTPQKMASLGCDVSVIEDFLGYLKAYNRLDCNLVLRSTVPIGTTKMLAEKYKLPNLVHSPEFLTARCAVTDAQLPARNIIGDPRDVIKGGCLLDPAEMLHRLYAERFQGVPVYRMTSDESEAVKLFTNGFFAVKLAYFNEVKELADWHDLNWQRVLEGVLSDGRISHSHTKVPGPDGKPGFGGSCLPKDLANLISHMPPETFCLDEQGDSVMAAALLGNRGRRKE